MSKLSLFNAAPIVLACWGMLVPTADIRAEEAVSTKTRITDIALGDGGVAVGVVVDGQGKPVDGASVAIKTDSKVVKTVVTDNKGEFAVREMRGGIYEIHAPQGAAVFRFWTAKAAPPAAKNRITIVSDAKAVRGQCGEHGCGTGGLLGGHGSTGAPVITDGGYWGNGAGSMVGDSVGNSSVFGGYSDAGFVDGGFVDGGYGHYCPPGTTPVYGGGGGLGLFGGGFLGTAAVIGGTIAIGAVIADELDDDDPVSP